MGTYVLVVDDNPSDLMMGSFLVEKQGAVAIKAENGFDAIEQLEEHDFKLFVVDLQMPQMSGLELIKRLRRTEKFKKTPILVVSGRSEVSDVKTAIQIGASDYIVKPIDHLIFDEKYKRLVGASEGWVEYEVEPDSFYASGYKKDFFQVLSVSEIGITLLSQHKLEDGSSLDIGAAFLEELGIPSMQTVVRSSTPEEGKYKTKLNYVGITESDRKKIRVFCADLWRESKKQFTENSLMKDASKKKEE